MNLHLNVGEFRMILGVLIAAGILSFLQPWFVNAGALKHKMIYQFGPVVMGAACWLVAGFLYMAGR